MGSTVESNSEKIFTKNLRRNTRRMYLCFIGMGKQGLRKILGMWTIDRESRIIGRSL